MLPRLQPKRAGVQTSVDGKSQTRLGQQTRSSATFSNVSNMKQTTESSREATGIEGEKTEKRTIGPSSK